MVCKRSPSSYIRAGVTRILWIWRHDAKEGSQLVYIPQLLFRVKKEWLDTRKDIPDWSRVRIASFFTRCISPGSSATPCLIWLRWRLGPLHTDSYAGIPTNHNYLNISIIRKMLANSYIISKIKVKWHWHELLDFHILIRFLATKLMGASVRFRQIHYFYILPLFCRRYCYLYGQIWQRITSNPTSGCWRHSRAAGRLHWLKSGSCGGVVQWMNLEVTFPHVRSRII